MLNFLTFDQLNNLSMKFNCTLNLLVVFAMFMVNMLNAQIKYPIDSALVNPLAFPREISANREIALIFDEKDSNNNWKMKHKFFDVNQLSPGNVDNSIALQSGYPVYTSSPNNAGNRHIGSCSGDFNGDHVDEYFTGTETPSHQIQLSVYQAQVMGAQMTVSPQGSTVNPGVLTQISATAGFIKLASGDFDNNGDQEAVLLFREDNSNELQMNIYDFDNALNPTEVAYQSDEIVDLVSNFESFDLQVADMDYDGRDEIIIAGAQWDGTQYSPFVKVYQVVPDGSTYWIYPKEQTFVPTGLDGSTRMSIALTTGDFNGDYIKEIALAYGIQITDNNGGEEDTWLRLFRVGDDTLNTPGAPDWLEKTVLLPQVYSATESINQLANLDLDAGDVDGNGTADIVLATGTELQLFTISPTFAITSTDALGGTYNNEPALYYDQIITVGDMNNDGRAEVLEMKNWIDENDNVQYFAAHVHMWNTATEAWQSLAVNNELLPQYDFPGDGDLRQYSVVIGDFDGDNLFFGDYNHFVFYDVVQPIIILNSPPTHSDDIGLDGWFDANGYWENDGDCSAFTSSYSESTSNSYTVQTTVSDAWSVSSATSAEFNGLVLSASASIEASYGENYSNSNASTQTTTEVVTTNTCYDDAIYASIVTYDVYEYPLYVADTLICNIISIHPRMNSISYQWIDSKWPQAEGYIPQHEPGNILSYRPYNSPQFALSSQDEFNGGTNFNLSTSANSSWEVTTEEVQSSSADTERSMSLGGSVSVGAFGVTEEISGSYDWSTLSTHSNEVGEAIMITTSFGNMPIASTNALYSVKPYIFWGPGNEVVVDYEVDANGSFYSENYSVQDPAWNMPWRLDPERGIPIDVQTKIRQSKSLWFDKKFATPGDTITAHARIYNYSLVATESPVKVQFYFGNPFNGGVAITDIDGVEFAVTDGNIQPQQYKEVEFTIVLPENFTYDGRLYARIDPDYVMTEVHESNNLCWRRISPLIPMSANDFETSIEEEDFVTIANGGFVCYPNPSNGQISFAGKMNEPGDVKVTLYNMQGQTVTSMVKNNSPAIVNCSFDVSELARGLYVAEIRCEGKVQRVQLILN